uniref:Nodule-specific cysteine-rich peptide L57 n=1 Tax=Lens culinaris TaxID=3864 RepID=A0A7T8DVB3_LENCU|nr:nodule-specific cysteine-rich peptide L57 [Lens culinaris]
MAEILKFVYNIFIFIFISTTSTDGVYLCSEDSDCNEKYCYMPQVAKCIGQLCKCVWIK